MFDISETLTTYRKFTYIVLPFLVNLMFLFFMTAPITYIWLPSDGINFVPILTFYFFYFIQILMITSFGFSDDGWIFLFGEKLNPVLITLIVFTFPIYYLFKLPFIIYGIVTPSYTPRALWERFGETSTFFYIPYAIFWVVYVLIIIIFSPVVFYICSPFGLGTFGVVLNCAILDPLPTVDQLEGLFYHSYKIGSFINCYVLSLIGIIMSIIHLAVSGAFWSSVLLLIFCCVLFFVECVPSFYRMFIEQNGYMSTA